MKNICIFCGSRTGNSSAIVEESRKTAQLLAMEGLDLVYGGGRTGLMGLIAEEFLAHGRKVTGIRPKKLIAEESAHEGLSEMIVVETMFERKEKMLEMSDAFISLPGGIGTLDELLEVFTINKIGFMHKPNLVLNYQGFYDDFYKALQQMIHNDFLPESDLQWIGFEKDAESLVKKLILKW